MSASLSDVREALAGVLTENIAGLNVPPRMVQANPPCAAVELERVDFHPSADLEDAHWFFKVTVMVSVNDIEAAQKQLDTYLSPTSGGSVLDAIEADPTLGGVVSDATVRAADGYQPYDVGEETFLGVRFHVEVIP